MEEIRLGQAWAPRDESKRRYYERVHGGPLRLRVQSVSNGSPWAVVVLQPCTGPVPVGRRRSMSASELRDGFELLGDEQREAS
jgi:hypothetical protein